MRTNTYQCYFFVKKGDFPTMQRRCSSHLTDKKGQKAKRDGWHPWVEDLRTLAVDGAAVLDAGLAYELPLYKLALTPLLRRAALAPETAAEARRLLEFDLAPFDGVGVDDVSDASFARHFVGAPRVAPPGSVWRP